MPKIFSIHEKPSYAEQKRGCQFGSCVTEEDSREAVIQSAQEYFCNISHEEGNYEQQNLDVILVTYDEDDDSEALEEISLEWQAENDGYDNGRFDYLVAIGAI